MLNRSKESSDVYVVLVALTVATKSISSSTVNKYKAFELLDNYFESVAYCCDRLEVDSTILDDKSESFKRSVKELAALKQLAKSDDLKISVVRDTELNEIDLRLIELVERYLESSNRVENISKVFKQILVK